MIQMGELRNDLTRHGLDLSTWGVGEAKTVAHLLSELRDQECSLVLRDGRLVREVAVAHVLVLHGGRVLIEDYQEFRDGRRRRRRHLGVAEKRRGTESADAAAVRGLREELGIEARATDLVLLGEQREEIDSPSYPGLRSDILTTHFTVRLATAAVPDSYTEEQPDKRTVWHWQEPPEWVRALWRDLAERRQR